MISMIMHPWTSLSPHESKSWNPAPKIGMVCHVLPFRTHRCSTMKHWWLIVHILRQVAFVQILGRRSSSLDCSTCATSTDQFHSRAQRIATDQTFLQRNIYSTYIDLDQSCLYHLKFWSPTLLHCRQGWKRKGPQRGLAASLSLSINFTQSEIRQVPDQIGCFGQSAKVLDTSWYWLLGSGICGYTVRAKFCFREKKVTTEDATATDWRKLSRWASRRLPDWMTTSKNITGGRWKMVKYGEIQDIFSVIFYEFLWYSTKLSKGASTPRLAALDFSHSTQTCRLTGHSLAEFENGFKCWSRQTFCANTPAEQVRTCHNNHFGKACAVDNEFLCHGQSVIFPVRVACFKPAFLDLSPKKTKAEKAGELCPVWTESEP